MKHLEGINELYKDTYKRAADKLKDYNHKDRADKMIKWAEERGISKPIERIYPYRFHFNIITKKNGSFVREEPTNKNEYFFIADFKVLTQGLTRGYVDFITTFNSNFGNVITLHTSINYEKINSYKIGEYLKIYHDDKIFSFKKRVDAYNFKKFLVEELLEEEWFDFSDIIKSISINRFYKSEEEKTDIKNPTSRKLTWKERLKGKIDL